MLIKTRGIVFKALKYSETSLILDIYTEEKGLRKYIISGVRSKGTKSQTSILQPTSLIEMVAYFRDNKPINRIKEIKTAHTYQSLPFDMLKGTIGLFMIELAQKTIKEEEANPELFHFLLEEFIALDTAATMPSNFHLFFMLQLAQYLGFSPNGNWSITTPFFDLKEGCFVAEDPVHQYASNQIVSQQIGDLIKNINPAINRKERQVLLDILITYYRLHIENFSGLNTPAVLKEVLEG